ncbi:MAG: M1 family aminopeptidase [Candidatus Izemoplasmatales bacterium]
MFYKGKIELKPKKHYMKCDINLSYIIKSEISELIVLLHKDVIIDSIVSNDLKGYIVSEELSKDCPFVLEAKRVILTLKQTLKAEDKLSIDFHYYGQIHIVTQWGVNRIDETFCELGLYTPWFPLLTTLPEATFDIDIEIPNEYTIINGYKISKEQKTYHIHQDTPHNDCSFLAFKNTKIYGDDHIKIYYFIGQENIAKSLFEAATKFFHYFVGLFGQVEMDKHLSFALPPREDGGGYSRKGLIVLNLKDDDMQKYFPYIGHEIAHLWWNKANVNSWEDWLNESFAEYSSLVANRNLYSIDEFSKKIKKYIDDTNDLPKIKGISRSDDLAHSVLYKKGPILLYQLESIIGETAFIALLKTMHSEKIINTKEFLDLLKKEHGKEMSDQFESWLDQ